MKISGIVILTCLLTGVVSAQEPPATLPEAPGVTVMQKKWRREVRHPALDEDPFLAGRDATYIQEAKKETIKANVVNKQLGRDAAPLPNRTPTLISSRGPSPTYLYEVKIMNTGEKKIRALDWEYVFFDPTSRLDVGRHKYRSEINLMPGKSKNLRGASQRPHTSIVDVTKTDKELAQQYSERIVINRIEYADGTVWQRPLN